MYSNFNCYFALIFGWGGKTAINVFLLITGFYMCKQNFNLRKVISLCIELMFYSIIIYFIFVFTGYENFRIKGFIKMLLTIPFHFGQGFTSSFIGMYFLIPFINLFLDKIDKKVLERLIITLLILFTGLSSFLFNYSFEYLGWYVTVYLIGSYIRMFPFKWMDNKKITGWLCFVTLVLSWLSVAFIWFVSTKINKQLPMFYFVNDSNKILAIANAIGFFLFFKNIKIGYNKIINLFAKSTFAVLLIHANSDTMRKWLWQDVCQNVQAFNNSAGYFVLHAIICTIGVYFVCVIIDIIKKSLSKRVILLYSNLKEKHERKNK